MWLWNQNRIQMDVHELFRASEDSQLITLEATVTSGFESLAYSEIREKVPVSHLHRTRGRVFFSTNVEGVKQTLKLRSIDHLYVIASTGKNILLPDDKDLALIALEELIESPNWNKIISIWRGVSAFKGNCFPSVEEHLAGSLKEASLKQTMNNLWREKEKIQENEKLKSNSEELAKVCGKHDYKDRRYELRQCIMRKADRKAIYQISDHRLEEEKVLKFRVTCYRSGSHSFTSQEVAYSLGGKLQDKFNWVVDLVHYDLEVVANIREDVLYLGVSLTPDSLHKRNIMHFGPTTLRATVCYNLLRMVSPSLGDIVLDPLCGGGSIPIEGALAFSGSYNLAGDNHPMAVARAFENIQCMSNEKKGYIDLVQWDVTNLPIRDVCVDVLVTDLPFGKRSGTKQNNQTLYQKAMLEIGRCVVPTGHAVCLTWDRTNFTRTLRAYSALWSTVRITTINLGGLQATAYVLKRSLENMETIMERLKKKKLKI